VGKLARKLRGGWWIAYNVGVAAFDSDLGKFTARRKCKTISRKVMWLAGLCCAAVLQGVVIWAALVLSLALLLLVSPLAGLWLMYSQTRGILEAAE
jgi:multisubunit Na+/H+ antiporter MnhG subunit